MTDAPTTLARVHGFLRGHDLEGDALIAFDRDSLALQTGRSRLLLERRSLDGWTTLADAVEVHLDGGDVVSFALDDPQAFARDLEVWALTLPEFTRSLRTFGSHRAAAGARRAEHDAFFAPLLVARGDAERASTAAARRTALDSRLLRDALERRLRDFAAERYPADAPERRALEAELFDCAEPMLARLATLAAAQERLDQCPEIERFHRWHDWSRTLAFLFESADACWPDLGAVLTDDRREIVSRWRFLRPGRKGQKGGSRQQEAESRENLRRHGAGGG